MSWTNKMKLILFTSAKLYIEFVPHFNLCAIIIKSYLRADSNGNNLMGIKYIKCTIIKIAHKVSHHLILCLEPIQHKCFNNIFKTATMS